MTDTDRPLTDIDRLPIAEAALRLGLSTDALRKRVARGLIPGEKVNGAWVVHLPRSVDRSATDTRPEVDRHLTGELVAHLQEEISFLRDLVNQQAHDLARERERSDVLQALTAQAAPATEPLVTHPGTPGQQEPPEKTKIPSSMDVFVLTFVFPILAGGVVASIGLALTSAGHFFSWDNLGKAAVIATIIAVPLAIVGIIVSIWLARRSPSSAPS